MKSVEAIQRLTELYEDSISGYWTDNWHSTADTAALEHAIKVLKDREEIRPYVEYARQALRILEDGDCRLLVMYSQAEAIVTLRKMIKLVEDDE